MRSSNATIVLAFVATVMALAGGSPAALQDGTLPIRRIGVDEMSFADKALGDKFRRFHTAAEKMAKQGWDRKPYETFTDRRLDGVAYAHWCTFVEQDRLVPINYGGPRELNTIQIGAFFDPNPENPNAHKNINGVFLYAKWKPAEAGWSAYLGYGKTTRIRDVFDCSFYCFAGPKEKPGQLPLIESFLDSHANYSGMFLFGEAGKQTQYSYLVTSWEKPRQVVLDDEVRRVLKSPESLRDYLLVPYRNLLKRLHQEIPEEKGYRATVYPTPAVSERRLSDAERKQVLQSACDEVELKIRTVQTHYKALFVAQQKAFPLRESLGK